MSTHHLPTPKSFSCISVGCQLDLQSSRTEGDYSAPREETFGSAPLVRTRVLDVATHNANLEWPDITEWIIKSLELAGECVCVAGVIRTHHHTVDINQVACSQQGSRTVELGQKKLELAPPSSTAST